MFRLRTILFSVKLLFCIWIWNVVENWEFYLVFSVIIGWAVSLDVCGLILSQYLDFVRHNSEGGRNPLRSSLRHALWHGGLFTLYTVVFGLSILVLPQILVFVLPVIEFLVRALFLVISLLLSIDIPFPNFKFDDDLIRNGLVWLFTLITVIFVIDTYRKKIAENHIHKHDTEDMIDDIRDDILLIVSMLLGRKSGEENQTVKADRRRRANNHLLAAAVAVDMLAMTTLIKFSLSNHPNGYSLGEHTQEWFIVLLLMSAVITATVFFFGFVSALISWGLGALPSGKVAMGKVSSGFYTAFILFPLRILEPLIVFYFLANLTLSLFVINGTSIIDDHVPQNFDPLRLGDWASDVPLER